MEQLVEKQSKYCCKRKIYVLKYFGNNKKTKGLKEIYKCLISNPRRNA